MKAFWSRPEVRGVRAAAVFLTRVPVGGFPYSREEWRWSTAHFPLVGAGLGAFLGLSAALLLPGLGPTVTAGFVLFGAAYLTGAFHEDGLADTADAMGGAFESRRLFEILKDSRVGTFGALALVLSVGLRWALLARLGPTLPWAVFAVFCAARTPPIWLMRALPYVTQDSEARSKQVVRAGTEQARWATGWAILALLTVCAFGHLTLARAGAILVAGGAVALFLGSRFKARAGGLTGDFLGCTEQVCEVVMLAVWAWGRS